LGKWAFRSHFPIVAISSTVLLSPYSKITRMNKTSSLKVEAEYSSEN
jgi:hypothetical protein